ncbi:hypothetical protein L195_g056125, partial [Trifolium pratense]
RNFRRDPREKPQPRTTEPRWLRVTTQKGLGEVVSRPPEADRTTNLWFYIATSRVKKRRRTTSLTLGEKRVENLWRIGSGIGSSADVWLRWVVLQTLAALMCGYQV